MAGASWHPYLPPNGFDTCAVCTCDPVTLEIHCPRVQCPSLPCSDKVAYRPDKKACCKKCPEVSAKHANFVFRFASIFFTLIVQQVKHSANTKKVIDPELMGDQGSKNGTLKSVEEILGHGGCKVAQTIYENGQDWHPVLPSLGEQKCIKCACKVI